MAFGVTSRVLMAQGKLEPLRATAYPSQSPSTTMLTVAAVGAAVGGGVVGAGGAVVTMTTGAVVAGRAVGGEVVGLGDGDAVGVGGGVVARTAPPRTVTAADPLHGNEDPARDVAVTVPEPDAVAMSSPSAEIVPSEGGVTDHVTSPRPSGPPTGRPPS